MKLSLVVLTPGKMEGKSIPVTQKQFLIGRDPECQLRPASALISKRHCALLVRGEQAFVRDFESTNGTALNDTPVKGEQEVHNGDRLRIGPLEFRIALEVSAPAPQPTPRPAPAAVSDDEAAAALLLSLQDDDQPEPGAAGVDSEGIPTGSTVMDLKAPTNNPPPAEPGAGGTARSDAAKLNQGNTSSAAKSILEKYMRRPRDAAKKK
jgi:predicted component of type VI protein secretion system